MQLRHILSLEKAKLLYKDILEKLDNPVNILYKHPISYYYVKLKDNVKHELVDFTQLSVIKERFDDIDDECDLYPTLIAEEMVDLFFPLSINHGDEIFNLKVEIFIEAKKQRLNWRVFYANKDNDILSFGETNERLFFERRSALVDSLFELYNKYKKFLEWKTNN